MKLNAVAGCRSRAPRRLTGLLGLALATVGSLAALPAQAQSATSMIALQGLLPVATLQGSLAGQAALDANYTVTGAIQAGSLEQPTLLPFALQQQQAIKDAFITGGNASELADALGTRLGSAYQALAHYDGPKKFTNVSPAVAELIAYTNETTGADSNTAKYFFANATLDGKTPVSSAAAAILTAAGGVTDIYGRAYRHPAGSPGADPYGDSRPFQTEPGVTGIRGDDYFGAPSTNAAYLRGPAQDLTDSPSFPSGHTTYGYGQAVLLGILVPERYQQQVARAAEYGNDRVILGAHYAMDVLAGRTVALHDLAHLLANDPVYVGQPRRRAAVITDYQAALKTARADLVTALQAGCGAAIGVCAADDSSRFSNPAANQALYQATQTYGLPVVYPNVAAATEDVGRLAPEAGYLLVAAFPSLTLAQADAILTATEGPGGGFLDNGSAFGVYSRLDLYAAAGRAASVTPAK
jgi:hypothetical protein